MDCSGFDCPMYIEFGSEDFNKSPKAMNRNPSVSENASNQVEDEQMISGNLSTLSSDTSDIYKAAPDPKENYLKIVTDKENSRNLSNQSQDFAVVTMKEPVEKARTVKPKRTIPKPFRFKTDDRIHSNPQNVTLHQEKTFTSALRENIVVKPRKDRITKPQPFHLTVGKKRKQEEEYVPLAEQAAAFQMKVPDRYHSSNKDFKPQEHWEPQRLVPKTPNLKAAKRRRVIHAISKEEQEEKELEEIRAHQFRARPVDPNIYKQPSKLKAVYSKTKLVDFRLRATRRATMHLRNRKKSQETYQFKARPVPKGILSGPTGLGKKIVIPATEPKPPAFEVDNRLEKRKMLEQEKKMQEEQKTQNNKEKIKKPHPNLSVTFSKPKLTVVQPFSFHDSDQKRFARKEKKIQALIEEESKPFVFEAQVMPVPVPSVLPVVPKKPPTKAEPFNFVLDNKNIRHASFYSNEENVSFKAQPALVLKKEPFIPEKLPKAIIDVQEFNLHTNRRASERQHLKELKEQEEAEHQRILEAQKKVEEERERSELMRLRQELVHKANPVRQYKEFSVKPSSAPLTAPKSPNFETDKRLQK